MTTNGDNKNLEDVERAIGGCADLLLELSWQSPPKKGKSTLSGQVSFSTEEYILRLREWFHKIPVAIEFGFTTARLQLTLTNLNMKWRHLGAPLSTQTSQEVTETRTDAARPRTEEATNISLDAGLSPHPMIKAKVEHRGKHIGSPGPMMQKSVKYVRSDWSIVASGSSEHPSWIFRTLDRSASRRNPLEGKTDPVPIAEFFCADPSCDCQVVGEIVTSSKDLIVTNAWKMTNGKEIIIQAILVKEIRDRLNRNKLVVKKTKFLASPAKVAPHAVL